MIPFTLDFELHMILVIFFIGVGVSSHLPDLPPPQKKKKKKKKYGLLSNREILRSTKLAQLLKVVLYSLITRDQSSISDFDTT